ncbi:hypothetical protein I4F81_004583 [Pyropia yezoensis]|uniref:Uncharacterized protein n=1 Tax=Pyropia yezoensis TaxID=2788 RepID=A0ACC3BVR6_PYRYE|nr:hypothetical protein I4F81_004583 [Neopyropia yezoensis]
MYKRTEGARHEGLHCTLHAYVRTCRLSAVQPFLSAAPQRSLITSVGLPHQHRGQTRRCVSSRTRRTCQYQPAADRGCFIGYQRVTVTVTVMPTVMVTVMKRTPHVFISTSGDRQVISSGLPPVPTPSRSHLQQRTATVMTASAAPQTPALAAPPADGAAATAGPPGRVAEQSPPAMGAAPAAAAGGRGAVAAAAVVGVAAAGQRGGVPLPPHPPRHQRPLPRRPKTVGSRPPARPRACRPPGTAPPAEPTRSPHRPRPRRGWPPPLAAGARTCDGWHAPGPPRPSPHTTQGAGGPHARGAQHGTWVAAARLRHRYHRRQ